MKYYSFLAVLISVSLGFSQQKITRTLTSNATQIKVVTQGIDELLIEESKTNQIEWTVLDHKDVGFIDSLTCSNEVCVFTIETKSWTRQKINDKINQFPLAAPSHVSAKIKIPSQKKVTILGGTIDMILNGYNGSLQIVIDKGKINLKRVLGDVKIDLFTGNVVANISKSGHSIKTNRGKITLDGEKVVSPIQKTDLRLPKLTVNSIRANVILSTGTQ